MINSISELQLPEIISKHVSGMFYEQIIIGYSNASVYKIIGKGINYYLKYMPAGKLTSIRHETDVIKWLHGLLPVAEVVEYTENERGEYLLMTEVEGENAAVVSGMEPEELISLYADGLRMIHAVPIVNCPFDRSLSVQIKDCLYNLDHDLVKLEYLHESRQGMSKDELRCLLINKNLPQEDFVFTHGDYCFPNVIIKDKKINGFIDFSVGGVADRYQDIADGGRSAAYNMKLLYGMNEKEANRYVSMFYKEYGIDQVDEEKIDLFLLIDDFHR